MKGLTIKREVHHQLSQYAKYTETMDTAIQRLITEAGDISDINPSKKGSTNIKISDETKEKLISMKLTPDESFSSVLERLFKKINGLV